MATTTYRDLERAFDEACESIRGQDTFTWIAPTIDALAGEIDSVNLSGAVLRAHADNPDFTVGSPDAETIGWAYECEGKVVARFTADAAHEAMRDLFLSWFLVEEN